ncbi:hypothetical protein [Paracoccus sediminicola]|uniref:hypothetical protein n=1 Tax=Paracoccus sediminicola TaxID=3017783 RepID=UPI0022F0098E|nr:hypothetical protein [Paracoccus sediminicola]WBU58106.1 hypothetical protein PAF18_06700 [Paracoccus sediminicola]
MAKRYRPSDTCVRSQSRARAARHRLMAICVEDAVPQGRTRLGHRPDIPDKAFAGPEQLEAAGLIHLRRNSKLVSTLGQANDKKGHPMNSIIYIVGLVVVVLFILSLL